MWSFCRGISLGFSETVYRITQTPHDALLPENNHGVKEGRRHRLTDNRHTRCIDQQTGFNATGFRNGARGMVASVVVPLGKRFERIGKF